jgi:hypothetical protein
MSDAIKTDCGKLDWLDPNFLGWECQNYNATHPDGLAALIKLLKIHKSSHHFSKALDLCAGD